MILKSLKYGEYEGESREWTLDEMPLGGLNLLVGKNASGKTRTLNLLKNCAALLAGKMPIFNEANFDLHFDHDGTDNHYVLTCHKGRVVTEEFAVGKNVMLKRGQGGVGRIYAVKLQDDIDFQAPEDQLAAVSRRDAIQHSYFEPLVAWGQSVLHFAFGSSAGQQQLAVLVKDGPKADPSQTDQVIPVFRDGEKRFGDRFTNAIIADMEAIGYAITTIGVQHPNDLAFRGPFPGELVSLFVQESDLSSPTEQTHMSQGMFRALSIIIQMNYSELASRSSCVVIDDIGEGLDFERSSSLIKLLVNKAQRSSVQLVMASNDRFVMNNVPLTAWSLLERKGPNCHVYNYHNSKQVFEDFRFTGLNNFDFLATDFLHSANEERPPR